MIVGLADQVGEDFLIIGQGQRIVRADGNDEVVTAGQIVLRKPDRFAQESFDAIAAGGGADPARNA